MEWLVISPIAGFTSILFAVYMFLNVNKQESGTARMEEMGAAIKEGRRRHIHEKSQCRRWSYGQSRDRHPRRRS